MIHNVFLSCNFDFEYGDFIYFDDSLMTVHFIFWNRRNVCMYTRINIVDRIVDQK